MNRVFSRIRTTVTLQATLVLVMAASVAGAGEVSSGQPGDLEPNSTTEALEAAIYDQGFSDDVTAQAVALLNDASASVGDIAELAAVTTELANVLVAPESSSADFLAGFFNDYEVVFNEQGAADWDIDPNPLKKCSRTFTCVWRSYICIRITWSEPGGGGGVNCISK